MKQNIYDNPEFFTQYMALRESGINYNEFIEQPAVRSLISNLDGKRVLDLGCGTGNFAMYCVKKGAAKVVGVDISEKMIERAKNFNHHEKITYICTAMEEFEYTGSYFDLVTSSLAIGYIKDYDGICAKISKLLKKNGECIISLEHPITTARKAKNNWITDEKGRRIHFAVDHYQDEGERRIDWYVENVIVYHRTFSTIINTMIAHGLTIERVLEPLPTEEGLQKLPKMANEWRRPSFLIVKARKNE